MESVRNLIAGTDKLFCNLLINRQSTPFLTHAYRPREAAGHERPLCADCVEYSKIARLRKSRKRSAFAISAAVTLSRTMRGSTIVFAAIDVVPTSERERRTSGPAKSSARKDFFYIIRQKRSFRRTLILARVAQAKGDNRTAIVRFERAAALQTHCPTLSHHIDTIRSGSLLPRPCCRLAVTPRRSGSSSVRSAKHHPMAGRATDWRDCIGHAATPSRPCQNLDRRPQIANL